MTSSKEQKGEGEQRLLDESDDSLFHDASAVKSYPTREKAESFISSMSQLNPDLLAQPAPERAN